MFLSLCIHNSMKIYEKVQLVDIILVYSKNRRKICRQRLSIVC